MESKAGLALALGSWPSCGGSSRRCRRRPQPEATRPPENNDQTLRPLGPDEIAPNLSFYAMDPLYKPGVPLGWSPTRIVEYLGRGLDARPVDAGKVYLSWRLLASDPADVAFNVYLRPREARLPRSMPCRCDSPPTSFTPWCPRFRTHLVGHAGCERTRVGASDRVSLPRRRRPRYRALKLRDDVRSVDRVGIGDLNADGTYDFVVKHPTGRIDPGRRVPSTDTYKIDAYNGRTGAFMWRIDLGWNINHGIWFSPMVVRDLDGDNKAEVCLRAAPYAATGEQIIPGPVPPQNELVRWDADDLRETHARGSVAKWKGAVLGQTQGSVQHVADIVGDWREEIVTVEQGELRIYSTSLPARHRRVSLMQDPLYRNDVAHRSMGYPHVPMTSYYLGARARASVRKPPNGPELR